MGGAITNEPLSLGGIFGFEPILDSELDLLNKNFHDCKMSLPCSLKPIWKVIWGQVEKRETGIPAPPWSCGKPTDGSPQRGKWKERRNLCNRNLGKARFPSTGPEPDAPLGSEDHAPPSYYVRL